MLDEQDQTETTPAAPESHSAGDSGARRRRAAARPAGPPAERDAATIFSAVAEASSSVPVEGRREREDPQATATDSAQRPPRRRRKVALDFEAPAEPAAPPASVLSVPLFQPPPEAPPAPRRSAEAGEPAGESGEEQPATGNRRRRGRNRSDTQDQGDQQEAAAPDEERPSDGDTEPDGDGDGEEPGVHRRRRRRRRGGGGGGGNGGGGSEQDTRETPARDEVTALKGSTRIEAKKQRRKEGRESGRRRAPVVSEAEFLARRESVKRTMVVRQQDQLTQIAVLEDGVLVEHYVNQATASSLVGNVYLGRVQNVLPSMEAAFVDIGRGRNAVLYAGEVNWDAAGLEGQPKRIEHALSSGDKVLVQVTKDPVGHKGARLTSQVSLPGRFLVFVPDGSITGISRKLPDKERTRLRTILRAILPEGAGVIVRTAAEGAAEDDLVRDVEHLKAQWASIQERIEKGNPPALLYAEPDLALRVVRDIFNSDFESLVVCGDAVGDTLTGYVADNAPSLSERVTRWTDTGDVFAHYRVTEQLAKALDRKVYLPSGGSLVIDRTEAMTVVDVNTGRFTGQGGNLEETVTRNNLEAAEEAVRQLRLRDVGGIVVIDFIDMVLESNRDLVLRRLIECLGRDRTRHQVAEVTSLGLVQMTRKRIGQGLLETFSEPCDCCNGRGVKVHTEPVEHRNGSRRPRSVRPPGAHDPVEAAAARARAASEHPEGADGVDEVDVDEVDVDDVADSVPSLSDEDIEEVDLDETDDTDDTDDGDDADEPEDDEPEEPAEPVETAAPDDAGLTDSPDSP